jgi:hypothetical protein
MEIQLSRYQKWSQSEEGQRYLNSEDRKQSYKKARQVHKAAKIAKFEYLRKIKLERGCLKCNYAQHHAALQFHHRNPDEKIFALAKCENFSWEMLLDEIEKCDVLCSNCHAILEYDKKIQWAAGVTGCISPS